VFVSLKDRRFAQIERVKETPVENSVNSSVDVFEEIMKRAVVKRTFFITRRDIWDWAHSISSKEIW
jgi:hypothetical protein